MRWGEEFPDHVHLAEELAVVALELDISLGCTSTYTASQKTLLARLLLATR
jgi:hypothetical protein